MSCVAVKKATVKGRLEDAGSDLTDEGQRRFTSLRTRLQQFLLRGFYSLRLTMFCVPFIEIQPFKRTHAYIHIYKLYQIIWTVTLADSESAVKPLSWNEPPFISSLPQKQHGHHHSSPLSTVQIQLPEQCSPLSPQSPPLALCSDPKCTWDTQNHSRIQQKCNHRSYKGAQSITYLKEILHTVLLESVLSPW